MTFFICLCANENNVSFTICHFRYKLPWMNFPTLINKTIAIFQSGCSIPCRINAYGLIALSMQTYIKVLKIFVKLTKKTRKCNVS